MSAGCQPIHEKRPDRPGHSPASYRDARPRRRPPHAGHRPSTDLDLPSLAADWRRDARRRARRCANRPRGARLSGSRGPARPGQPRVPRCPARGCAPATSVVRLARRSGGCTGKRPRVLVLLRPGAACCRVETLQQAGGARTPSQATLHQVSCRGPNGSALAWSTRAEDSLPHGGGLGVAVNVAPRPARRLARAARW